MLRVVVLCSHRAPGLVETLANDLNRGVLYDVVGCVTSEAACADAGALERLGVTVLPHDIRTFHQERGATLSNRCVREEYDRTMLAVVGLFAADMVLCCGYLYVLSEAFLDGFEGPIVNLHHSDLTVAQPGGAPNYPGLRAVRNAVIAGESETRSTAHLVTAQVDAGPPLVRTWPFPISPLVRDAREWGAIDMLKAYAYAHQEWMLRASWPALIAATLALFATGRVIWQTSPPRINGHVEVLELEPNGVAVEAQALELAAAGQ